MDISESGAALAVDRLQDTITTRGVVVGTGRDGVGVAGGWNINGGVGAQRTSSPRRKGVPFLRITDNAMSGAAGFITAAHKVNALAFTGIKAFVRVGDPSIQIYLRYSSTVSVDGGGNPLDPPSTTAPPDRRRLAFDGALSPDGTWFGYGANKNGSVYVSAGGAASQPAPKTWTDTGAPNKDLINLVFVEASIPSSVPNGSRWYDIDIVLLNEKPKTYWMVGFDGFGDTSVIANALPILDRLNIPSYLAGDGDKVAEALSRIQQFYDRGSPILGMGLGHINYANNPTLVVPDFTQTRAILDAAGFTYGRECAALPNGGRSPSVDASMKSLGYQFVRGGNFPAVSASTTAGPSLVSVGSFDTGRRTAAEMNAWVDNAILNGESGIEYTHQTVTYAPTNGLETSLTEYRAHMEYLAALHAAGTITLCDPVEYVRRMASRRAAA